ncbi:MAG: hypothetical protein KG012_17300 [Deltaproteobacteria bacterium]|nr:hypothetical protein [Deltaproteobacteria bacterium]
MTMKDFYNSMKNTANISELKKVLASIQLPDGTTYQTILEKLLTTDPSELPVPLQSPQRMLLARHLAVEVSPEDSFTGELKGKWQRYWLRCCLKDECNYFFSLFKEFEINRENDVEAIIQEEYLWNVINSEEGKKFYKQTIAEWFLKRYNKKKAKSVLKTITGIKWLDKIRFWYPRLIVAILIGFLPLITQKDMWLMPLNLSEIFVVFLSVLLFALSYGYLVYECNKIINDITEARKRASCVCLQGFLISLLFSIFICLSIGPAILNDRTENIIESNCIITLLELGNLFWKDIIFFAFSALFIGIFIQLLWEEKTVTEPL